MFTPEAAWVLFIFSIIFAFFISLFWLWIFYRLDKDDPESKKLLTKLFSFGAIFAFIIAITEAIILGLLPWLEGENPLIIFLLMFAVIAPIEEYGKYWILKRLVFNRAEFNQVIDGVIYAVVVALGFALFENIGYFGDVIFPSEQPPDESSAASLLIFVLLFRFLFTTLMHATASGIIGFKMGQAKLLNPQKGKELIRNGFLLAVFLHGSFNFFLFVGAGYYSILILVGLAIFLFKKFKEPQNIAFYYPRRFCGNCGAAAQPISLFCGNCGAKN